MNRKNKKEQKEEKSLNKPVAKYFRRKIKCNSVQTEFKFSNIRLDVLGYNSNEKCFYICEGKMLTAFLV
ncbi:MAG: hypothetical protein WHT27_07345 [candidate division WOR-3 bacterium]